MSAESPRSSQRGTVGQRRRQSSRAPTHSTIREKVPTGQTQLQNPLRARSETASAATRMVRPAGWTGSHCPDRTSRFRPSRAAMGRKASTDGGRVASTGPPETAWPTKRANWTPTATRKAR